MSKGIVVDHKRSGVRYAISEERFNPKDHVRVRDLRSDESVLSYVPRRKQVSTQAPAQVEDPKSTTQKGN